jgi:hypothetical protein
VSVKFDPYMYLSLPLPNSDTRILPIYLVDLCGQLPLQRVALTVTKQVRAYII